MEELVLSKEDISRIVKELGARMTEDLANEDKPPVFLCVMKGAMPFYSDLVKEIHREILCDYVQISSYEGTSSTGSIKLQKDVATDLTGRTVVLVEDIIDTGLSIQYLVKHIEDNFKPKRVLVCALFDKYLAHKDVPIHVDYCGKRLEETKFLVGYGLDYKQLLRNVPYVYVPTKEEIETLDSLSKKD